MARAYLEHRQTLAFGGLITNTLTHTVMYAYYTRAALKLQTPWKAWALRGVLPPRRALGGALCASAVDIEPSLEEQTQK